jgi:hypothetical protein
MATIDLQNRLANWEVLNTNLKTNLAALPELQAGQERLETYIAEGQALVALQSRLTAEVRDIGPNRLSLVRRGSQHREFLAAALRNTFGADSQRLIEFGVKPRRRPRRSPTTPEGEMPNPPAPPMDE